MKKQKNASNIENSSPKSNNISKNNSKIKILSIILAFVSLLLFVALLSFNKQDEANAEIGFFEILGIFTGDELINLKAETTQNLLGLLGAYISNFFYNHTTGYSSIIIPFILILWSLDLFQNLEIKRQTLIKSVLLILMSITTATLMGLFFDMDFTTLITKEWSGTIGFFMADIISKLIGLTGATLFCVFVILLLSYYTFGLKIDRIFDGMINQSNNLINFSKDKLVQLKENSIANNIIIEENNEFDTDEISEIENNELTDVNLTNNLNEPETNIETSAPLNNGTKDNSELIESNTNNNPNNQNNNEVFVKLATDNNKSEKFVTRTFNDNNNSNSFFNPNMNSSVGFVPGVGKKININFNIPEQNNNSFKQQSPNNQNTNNTNNTNPNIESLNNQNLTNQNLSNQVNPNDSHLEKSTPNNEVKIFEESVIDIRDIVKNQQFENPTLTSNTNPINTNPVNITSVNTTSAANYIGNFVETSKEIPTEKINEVNTISEINANQNKEGVEPKSSDIDLISVEFDMEKELNDLENNLQKNQNIINLTNLEDNKIPSDELENLFNKIKQPDIIPYSNTLEQNSNINNNNNDNNTNDSNNNNSNINKQELVETKSIISINDNNSIKKEEFNFQPVIKESKPKYVLSTEIHNEEINYVPPKVEFLLADFEQNEIDKEELEQNAKTLQEKLETFKITIENLTVTPGPVVTLYEFVPSAGIKISKIESFEDDLAMALKARGIRMIAPIPGRGTVGIEIPNNKRQLIRFISMVESEEFQKSTDTLPLALGKDVSGHIIIADLNKMPHLLIAGTTGSGKSVGINTIILSLIYKKHPSELKFIIIDPKKVELQQYSGLSQHFMASSPDVKDTIITNPADSLMVLKSAVLEMEERYTLLSSVGSRNISEYNEKVEKGLLNKDPKNIYKKMPFIVVIIDELADLMVTAGKEIEEPIVRLAQMARAVGIHLILATQRPSVNVITGLIKSNFPTRIAYSVKSKIDSRTILDMSGAEQLLGYGDMLFLPTGYPKPIRIQNSYLTTEEVEAVCEHINQQVGYSKPYMLPSTYQNNSEMGDNNFGYERDELFFEAARVFINSQSASTSSLQRKLRIGYARAGKIVDELEASRVIGPANGSKPRDVLMMSESELERLM